MVTDNLAALAVFSRGRSSRPPLAGLSRNAAALVLAYGLPVVYRWTESSPDPVRLTSSPLATSEWVDAGASNGSSYLYAVSAIDGAGNESPLS